MALGRKVHQGNLEGQAPLHKALFASNFFLYITWVKMQSARKEHTFVASEFEMRANISPYFH